MALMGPSGSGKTTLLNCLARRTAAAGAKVDGAILVNGTSPSNDAFRSISSYVEQEDALIGSLTVRETINFAGRLSLPSNISRAERIARVDHLLKSFGLQGVKDGIVGTPLRKGISGGQKRRLSVAAQLITSPKILFLDEPTSGLDSATSAEVVGYLSKVAKAYNLIVIASIHQPSTSTFQMFDSVFLLSGGKQCYAGPVSTIDAHFDAIGFPMPNHMNPAEHIIDVVNTDFLGSTDSGLARLERIHNAWKSSATAQEVLSVHADNVKNAHEVPKNKDQKPGFASQTLSLLHRLFIKSYRDILAYGVRIAMYLGLAIMMGTVWLRLDNHQNSIIPFTNAIFFGSAFMSFMAVAYVPAFLEDRSMYVKERANGLYGSGAFLVSNFLIGLPYLFLITLLFSIIAYWLSNFQPSAIAFFTWIMWLFLDLVAAESLVVLVSSLVPNFVGALAITAFANGLWMSVGGFLVTMPILNVFYKYVFHYIDYQAYVFQGMMVNEFGRRTFNCATGPTGCHCMYPSALEDQCKIAGDAVLKAFGYKYSRDMTGQWVGILLAIVLGMRLISWGVLAVRR